MVPSLRMQAVQSPIIPIVAEWIRSCPGTISLGQGVVGYPPPPEASEEMARFALEPENHKYKPVIGLPALLDALTRKLADENHISVGKTNALVVTAGGNMAFMNAVLAVTSPGDNIIIQAPYYFNHEMAIHIAGCQPIIVSTDANYQLDPELIARTITPRTRAVVTISPNNPTGAVYPEAALTAINDLCAAHGIYHIHDEAYEYFTYDDARHFSPASLPRSDAHTISLFSLSKAYGFASWRIGYMLVPQDLLFTVKKIQDTILICPPVVSQFAALGCLKAGRAYCRKGLVAITECRHIALKALRNLDAFCTVPPAQGAFYFLLKIDTEIDSVELAERLVREHRVAVIPGATFGLDNACYLRVGYGALDPSTAAEGMGRLTSGLKKILRS